MSRVNLELFRDGGDSREVKAGETIALNGSTGVPENFLVDPGGRLALIRRGPVDEEFLEQEVVPIVERRR